MDPLDFFPYNPRSDQKRIIREINKLASEGSRILFDAPTGYGKTPVVLSALLPIAISLRKPIIWIVRTGNETDRPIEELKVIHDKLGLRFLGLSIRGKRDMCLEARNRGISDHEGVSVLCRRIREKCPYYRNLLKSHIKLSVPLTFSEILKYGERNKLCPYFLQLNQASNAILISMSYNYLLSERIMWSIRYFVRLKGAFLVVDEAHNLQSAVSSVNSDRITIGTVDRALKELERFKEKRARALMEKIKKVRKTLEMEARALTGEDDVFDPLIIIEKAEIFDDDFGYAKKLVSQIYSLQLREGKSPRSSLRHLITFFEESIQNLDTEGVVFLKYKEKDKYVFERWDMRAAEALRDIWKLFSSIIFMSGTLKPFNAFADIVGINKHNDIVASFQIPRENVLSLILKGLSTRGEVLSSEMKQKYIKALSQLIENINKNTAIFFASYRIMNDLIDSIIKLCEKMNRGIFIEREGMRGDEARKILNEFRVSKGSILCATMMGRFAEGADFPGEALEAIILVGIPFERMTVRTSLYIDYYEKLYGTEKGRFYAYILPALRRASQAMGRALRSPTDKAIIIAADERYWERRYFNLLPEYFRSNAKLVNLPAALDFIHEFSLE